MIGLSFREEFVVEDHQQLPVTVYDYYEPGNVHVQCIVMLEY